MNMRSLVKKMIPAKLFKKIEPFGHLLEAVFFNVINGFPAKNFKVIGVTGTNGKTSTSYMIHRMMHEAGYKVGLMTTVAYGAGMDIKPQIHHMTNVSVPELMKRLKYLKSQGVEWLVLETTSHALAQNRVWGIPYSIAVMTNVTHEHLDYHGTFENYREAKIKLFKLVAQNKKGLGIGVINAEDPSAELFTAAVPKSLTYGVAKGNLQATTVNSTPNGSDVTAVYGNTTLQLRVNIPGSFNVANALAAAGVGIAAGMTVEQIQQGIAALTRVEGRMDPINEGQNFTVIVDFAHTPDSFEKLFKDLRPVVKGKLICLFGSAGRRDEAKRSLQGELAGRYCDIVIITEEDDRDIDGLQIMEQIAEGAELAGKTRQLDLFMVHDRTQAIQYAVQIAEPGDTVLLLGKGHEKTIERADGEHPWDEIGIAHAAVQARMGSPQPPRTV